EHDEDGCPCRFGRKRATAGLCGLNEELVEGSEVCFFGFRKTICVLLTITCPKPGKALVVCTCVEVFPVFFFVEERHALEPSIQELKKRAFSFGGFNDVD